MVSSPVARGRQQHPLWLRPIAWLWAQKIWIAATVGALPLAATLYVLWAVKDLPDAVRWDLVHQQVGAAMLAELRERVEVLARQVGDAPH